MRWRLGSHLVGLGYGRLPCSPVYRLAIVSWSFGTPFGKHLGQWVVTVRCPVILLCYLHVKSFAVMSVAVRPEWSLSQLSPLSLVMPFGKPFGTLSGHIQLCLVPQFGSHVRVIQLLVRNCFGRRICSHSAWIRLVSLLISVWSICRYTWCPSYAMWTDPFRSWGALAGSPPGVLVGSSLGVLAITWLGALIVVLWVH